MGLQACSTYEQPYSMTYNQTSVSWKDFLKVSELHRSAFVTQPGESIYMFNAVNPAQNQVQLLSGETVATSLDCFKLAADHSGPAPKTDKVKFENCVRQLKPVNRNRNTSVGNFSALLRLAERAVKDEGSCVWPGYDRAFDTRVRAVGALARADDNRFFFVKMRCRS